MRIFVGIVLLTSVVCYGQNLRAPSDNFTSTKPSDSPTSLNGSDYRIGSDDQLDIDVFEIMELAATPRVSASGVISLKMIGNLQAGGLTPQQLERAIEKSLVEKKLVNDPHVTVTVREYASQPVSIIGAVRMPGTYQLKGEKTLFGMISQAQGLDQATAGNTIQVFRGDRVITIDVEDFERGNVTLDIPIYANDRINVPVAGSVFVMGEVRQPGEFILRNGVNISVLNAITKGGGPTKEAKQKGAVIIRMHQDGRREDIQVDLDKMANGKVDVVQMMPNDILFIPANKFKAAMNRTLESTIGVVSNRIIYRF